MCVCVCVWGGGGDAATPQSSDMFLCRFYILANIAIRSIIHFLPSCVYEKKNSIILPWKKLGDFREGWKNTT